MPEALLIATPNRQSNELARQLRLLLPKVDVRIWPELGDPDDIVFAIAWQPPRGLFAKLPNLRAVSSLGAGVDGLVDDPELPATCPLGRLAGPRLAADMAGYLSTLVLHRWRRLGAFTAAQQARRWQPWAPDRPPTVGLLGTGALGRKAAAVFNTLDIPVIGYNLGGFGPKDLEILSGEAGLTEIANRSDFLINLLPLTPVTLDILNAELFASMKAGSTLINVGRGEHLVESDLLDALAVGRPNYAILDVFRDEPLPETHPFWAHANILITPHCASVTSPAEAAQLAAESYRRVIRGKPPLGQVDRQRGY